MSFDTKEMLFPTRPADEPEAARLRRLLENLCYAVYFDLHAPKNLRDAARAAFLESGAWGNAAAPGPAGGAKGGE